MTTVCANNKIDSNVTGLRIAQEVCLKQLPTLANDGYDPTWFAYEPNSYSDTGATVSTTARNPINPSRQNKKGVVTDLDAKGGFNSDLTQNNLGRLMQGFVFAAARQKTATAPYSNPIPTAITSVTASTSTYATAKAGFKAGDVILAVGFGVSGNNGVKTVVSVASGTVVVSDTIFDEASPPAGASLQVVGFQFPTTDASIAIVGGLPQLVSLATNMTTLGVVPGEWVFLGGDLTTSTFNSTNKGFARVNLVTATYIQFDKINWLAPVADVGTGKKIRLYLGTVIKNESDPSLIVRQTYQLERTLGNDTVGPQAQYVTGCVADTFTLNVAQAAKVTMDLAYVACDSENNTGTMGLKVGARPGLVDADAFNTSSDIMRISVGSVDPTTALPEPLFGFCTDLTVTIKNNASGAKAVGVLGNFETTVGTFTVGGSMTAYFMDMRAVQAVRNNSDITLDVIFVKNNAGIVFDIPLLSLGNGLPTVDQDKPIMIPLDTTAAESSFGHTLMYVEFPHLPNAADL